MAVMSSTGGTMSRTTARSRRFVAPVLVALAIGSLAACGDDDDETTTAADETTTTTEAEEADGGDTGDDGAAEGDLAAYCDAALAIEVVPEPEIDFESLSPEEQAEAAKQFAAENLVPLAEELQAVAPEEVAEQVAAGVAAVNEVAETGDFAAFENPETDAALTELHAFDLENCGWESIDASGIDYGFQGVPATVPAGPVSFEFTNDSTHQEAHEFVVFKKNEGVTQSATELLQLPEEEAMTMASFVSATFAPPGESDYTVTELEPGDYFVACFIPVGSTEENPEGSGPPHFMEGMVTEFSVE
jgi:hypothetical protein